MRNIIAAVAFFMASTVAIAQPYLTLTFGEADADVGTGSISGGGVNVGAGYSFGRYLAVEASYFDGDGDSDPETQGASTITTYWEASGAGLSLIGKLPVGDVVSVFLRGGAVRLETERRVLTTTGGSTTEARVSDSEVLSRVGVGADFGIAEHVLIRAEVEQSSGGDLLYRLRQFSVGVIYRF